MSTILYGNFSLEIIDDLGTRVSRPGRGPNPAQLLSPRHLEAPTAPLMRGRTRESADALGAISLGRPYEFHASCGFGKTTLLLRVAVLAAGHGIAPHCLYARMDSDRVEDLLHQLVTRLFSSARPVKLTPDECAQVLGTVSAVAAIDDVSADPEQIAYLLDVLRGCRVVIGAPRPVLDGRGDSRALAGLPEETALLLLSDELARPLGEEELPAARRLVAAVAGQPLHLRQAAALVRDGGHPLATVADQAEQDPGTLDRLSVSALAEGPRRALAMLALVAGAMITPNVAAILGGVADLGESLDSLHHAGLAERGDDDRFGLPACKTASYRELLVKELSLAASAQPLCEFLVGAMRNPSAIDSHSAADAALALIELAAERRDWTTVVQLVKAADAVLFVTGRWQALRHALGRGLAAAKASGDGAAEALFCHQLGSLALCRGDLGDALKLLRYALALREQLGELAGAELTRRNLLTLELSEPKDRPPRPLRLRVPARVRQLAAVAAGVGGLALGAGGIALALTHSPGPSSVPVTPTPSPTAHASPATSSSSAFGTTVASRSPDASSSASASASANSSASPSNSTRGPSGGQSSVGTSAGPVTVPDVINETQSVATATLQGLALTVRAGWSTYCGSVPYGDVVGQKPAAGSIVDSGTVAGIVVCDAMPNVLGLSEDVATVTLQGLGLTVDTGNSDCAAPELGDVVDQAPVADAAAPPGSTVTLAICTQAITP